MSGSSFSYKFNSPGTFNYFCMIHPWMQGQVNVQGTAIIIPPTYDTTPPKILKPTNIIVDAENQNGARVTYEVLAIDETDQLIRPICNPSSGTMFSVGTTKVTCNARDSAGNRAQPVSFSITVNPPKLAIPDWVKNVASFWCEDKIGDQSFTEGIQYLINNNIIIVSASSSGYSGTSEIPNWVKNNACWWSEGLIEDTDFASGIEYLVNHGIIRV
ncbi:MAG: HYR domain-containing protein [Thaumarchaeota archaeon]|nr:HYR domain-containing protein [Nitrososphaerota archaeon]